MSWGTSSFPTRGATGSPTIDAVSTTADNWTAALFAIHGPATNDPTGVDTFGYFVPTAPGTTANLGGGGVANTGDATASLIYTAGGADTLVAVGVNVYSDNQSTDDMNLKLYTMTSGQPDDRVTVFPIEDIGFTQGSWQFRNASYGLASSVTYCLTADTSTTEFTVIYYETGGTNDAELGTSPLGDPWGSPGTNQDRKYLMFAVVYQYSTGGGGAAASGRRRTAMMGR